MTIQQLEEEATRLRANVETLTVIKQSLQDELDAVHHVINGEAGWNDVLETSDVIKDAKILRHRGESCARRLKEARTILPKEESAIDALLKPLHLPILTAVKVEAPKA